MKNVIKSLQGRITQNFPDVRLTLDEPVLEHGFWVLYVTNDTTIHLHLQGTIIGSAVGVADISPPRDECFSTGVDELFPGEDDAYQWVVKKLAAVET
jgi:hypothetical protein